MKRKPRIGRVIGALAISLSLALGAATAAQANSIVYLKTGNVWLSTPDGTQGYKLTFDGGWDSPSEADNGTIMAVKNGETYRFSPSGPLLGAPVPTVFHGADPSTTVGPAGVRISPDATKQAYWGTSYSSYEDYTCGCVMFRWEAYTRWGASDQFNEPNQTTGQQLYGEPAWIDNNTRLVTDIGSLFGDQVATYTVGGGDNSLTQWFSDPDTSVKNCSSGPSRARVTNSPSWPQPRQARTRSASTRPPDQRPVHRPRCARSPAPPVASSPTRRLLPTARRSRGRSPTASTSAPWGR